MLLLDSCIKKKCLISCYPSFQIFAAPDWIDTALLINKMAVSLSFWSVPSKHIQEAEQVCKFKTQIIKKAKLMTHTFIARRK